MANNNDKKVLNVPALRFPEFSGEWKSKFINDLASVVSGGTPDTSVKSFWNGNIQWFTPSEIGKNKYVDSSLRTITEEGLNNSSAKLLPPHTILLSSRATVGECSLSLKECATNQGFQSLIAQSCDTNFLYYLIQTKKKDLIRKACGSTFLEISANEVRKIQVKIPYDNEQKKIADFLSLIDERIFTQNKIIEKLKSLIKGITILLTTKGKPNTTIAQCLECHSSTLQESDVSHSELYKVFGANGLIGYTDMPQMNGDAILIIKDGSGVGTTSYAQGEFSVIGTLNYLTAISNYDLRYLYFVLSVFNFQSYKTGMAIPHIYFKDYGNAKIYCPPLSEQKRIANVLGKLESKLYLEQNILASFNLQKRYLLGQMFI